MDPREELYGYFQSRGWIGAETPLDKFNKKFDTPEGVKAVHDFLKGEDAVNMDLTAFSGKYLKKKVDTASTTPAQSSSGNGISSIASDAPSEPSAMPGQTQDQQTQFPTIQFDRQDMAQDATSTTTNETTRFDPVALLNVTGDEDPIEHAEMARYNRDGADAYEKRKQFDERNDLRSGARRAEDAMAYGNTATNQIAYNNGLMEAQFGQNWQNKISALQAEAEQTEFPERKEEIAGQINAMVESEPYKKIVAGSKALGNAEARYYLEANNGALGTYKRMAEEKQAQADKNYENSVWAPKRDFVLRKGMEFLGSALTLPRTLSQAVPGTAPGGELKVVDALADWGDEILQMKEVEFPKPVQLQASAFEDVVDFKGSKVVLNNSKPAFIIKDGKRSRITEAEAQDYMAAGPEGKQRVEFSGAMPLLDKVVESAADLMIMRYTGGGSKLGTSIASIALTHNGLYNEALDAGMDPDSAAEYAATGAILNGAIESHLGKLETKVFSGAVNAERKAITKAAVKDISNGMSASQAAWSGIKNVAWKEVKDENKEEILQSLAGDYVRQVFQSQTNPLKAETDAKSMGETILATTLLTAPLAALGMRGYATAARRSALMSAIDNPNAFTAVVNGMVESGQWTQAKADQQVAKIDKLSRYRASLPDGLTFEQQSQAMARQEFVEDKTSMTDPETVMPAQAKQNKEEIKLATEEIAGILNPEGEVVREEATVTSNPVTVKSDRVKEDTIADIQSSTVNDDVNVRAEAEATETARISDMVEQRITDLGGTPSRPKIEAAVAEQVFNAAVAQDEDKTINNVVDDIARELTPVGEMNPPTTVHEAVQEHIRIGGRVSSAEERKFPDAQSNWFADDAPSVNDLAQSISQQLGVPVAEAKAGIADFIKRSPDKKRNIVPAEIEAAARAASVDLSENDLEQINSQENAIQEGAADIAVPLQEFFGTPEAVVEALTTGNTKNTPLDGKESIFEESESPVMASTPAEESQDQQPGTVQVAPVNVQGDQPTQGGEDVVPESLRINRNSSPEASAGQVEQRAQQGAVIAARAGITLPVNNTPSETSLQNVSEESTATTVAVANTPDLFGATRETEAEFIVIDSEGIRDSLRDAGGIFQYGKGWVFPIADKKKAMAAIDKVRKPSPRTNMNNRGGMSGRLGVAMRDKFVAAANAMRGRRMKKATISEAIDIIAEDANVQAEGVRDSRTAKFTEMLQKAFPNIKVITDPLVIDSFPFEGVRPAGFVKDGVVYVDLRRAGPDTPMHEFGHIWEMVARTERPELHNLGISSMEGSEYEAVVRANPAYAGLSDSEVLQEALALAIGERGARIMGLSRWQQFMEFMGRLSDWLKHSVGGGIDPMMIPASDFADLAAMDILRNGGDYTSKEISRIQGDVVKFQYNARDAQDDMDVANKMYSEGINIATIRAITGFTIGADGRWEWRPIDSDIAPDILEAIDGEILSLDTIIFSDDMFKADPALKEVKVLFSTQTKQPALAVNDEGIYIVMPVGAAKDTVSADLRRLISDIAMIRIGIGVDVKIAQNVSNTGLLNISDSRQVLKSLISSYREIAEALKVEPSTLESKKNFALRGEEVPVDFASAEALGLPTPPAAIVPGFDDIENEHARYDASKDALRKSAVRAGARVLIDRAVRTGEATADELAGKFYDRFGIDYDWTYAQFDEAQKLAPGGSRRIDYTKAKKAEAKKAMQDKIAKWFKRQFSYKGLLPKDIFDLNRRRAGEVNAILYQMDNLTAKLEDAMKVEFGKNMTLPANSLYPSGRELVDAILKGDAPIEAVSPELGAIITSMRAMVDKLSVRLLLSGSLQKSMVITILEGVGIDMMMPDGEITDEASRIAGILSKPPFMRNEEEIEDIDKFLSQHTGKFGTYLNRSYRVHSFPDWTERIPEDVMIAAKAFIQKDLIRQAEEITQGLAEYEDATDRKKKEALDRIKQLLDDIEAKISTAEPGNIVKLSDTQQEMMDLLGYPEGSEEFKEFILDDTEMAGVPRAVSQLRAQRKKIYILEQRREKVRAESVRQLDSLHGRIKNIDGEINRVLDYKTALYPVSNKGVVGAKDRSILKNRKDIPDEIRALLGEFKDPTVNFTNTILKMGNLVANQEFLNSMRKRYEGVYFFEDPGVNKENWKQFGSEGNQNLAPLSGWYTTPDIHEAMLDFYEPAKMDNWIKAFIAYAITPIKLGKTVLSPETHPRNFFGNAMFHLVHGWVPTRAANAVRDFKDRNKNNNWADRAEKYHRLGIFGESVGKADVENMMKDIEERYTLGTYEGTGAKAVNAVSGAARFIFEKAKNAYEAEDDIHRVVAFENEVAKYAKAWYGQEFEMLSPEQQSSVEARAAEIVSMVMPTASFVPRILKAIRRFPFTGTFVTFPAEMLRVTYNTAALAKQEINDPRTRGLGVRRIAGLTMAIAGMQGLALALKSLFGYDDEYWGALNRFLPEYSRNSQIMPVGKSEKGFPKYWNAGYTNPFSFMNKSYNAFTMTDNPARGLVDGLYNFVDPFFSPELTFSTMVYLFQGRDDKGRNMTVEALKDPIFNSAWMHPENLKRRFLYAKKKLAPGIVKSIYDASDIVNEETDPSGRVKTWSQYMMGHLMGVKIETFDPQVSAGIKANQLKYQKNEARAIYTSHQNTLNRGWKSMHRGDDKPSKTREDNYDAEAFQELNDKYSLANEAYISLIKEAHQTYIDMVNIGIDEAQAIDIFKEADFSLEKGEISAIQSGNVSNLRLLFKKKERY